jgi:hypothetical protein
MTWRFPVVLCVVLTCTGCYTYNTHLGRVGQDASPFTEPQPGTDPVMYGSTPMNRVPDLVMPVTRTVWIKGHQLPNGDYVGDYPLTIVFTRGAFVRDERPDVTIPHAIRTTDGVSPTHTSSQPSGQAPPRAHPPHSSRGALSGVQQTPPHVTDYLKQLQQGSTKALPQRITQAWQEEAP